MNAKDARLPRYLIVILDYNIIKDLSDVHNFGGHKIVSTLTDWVVCKLNVIVRRKRVDLWEKKPGSLSGLETHLIFVKMIRRIGSFHQGSNMQGVCALRPKFNDVLNDAVSKIDQRILTINSYNTYDHFDKRGNLSQKGKTDFWYELDDLIYRYEIGKVKLLPNPKNPPRHVLRQTSGSGDLSHDEWIQGNMERDEHVGRRKLPMPPPHH